MSEMSDFFKRMAEQGTQVTGVGPGGAEISIGPDGAVFSGDLTDLTPEATGPRRTFAEQAMDKAIYSLGEIIYFAECNRPKGCLSEATEALDLINILLKQHEDEKLEKGEASPVVASDEPSEDLDD